MPDLWKWNEVLYFYFEVNHSKRCSFNAGGFQLGNENQIFEHFIQSFSKYFSKNLVNYVLTYFHSIDVHELNPKLN